MDIVIFLNIIVFLLIAIFIFKRYKKYKKIQLIDFLLIFYALFFPIGLIRPYMGYESIIGYDIFYNYTLLERSSWIVLVFLIIFVIGCSIGNSSSKSPFRFKKNNKVEVYSQNYLSIFKKITFLCSSITFLLMVMFIRSQGSILEYFQNIDSIRQTLSGQMGNWTVIYLNVLLSLYTILIHKKVLLASKIGIFVSIVFFVVYGFRGPVIGILIIVFFILQKLKIFNIKVNLKNILIGGIALFLYVYSQDARDAETGGEPFFLRLLTRFFGYEPVMVIVDKVIDQDMFTIDTFITNVVSFFQLPIPRGMMEDKIKPVSILLTDKLFYNVGNRDFSTGGISPTIVGSLIWNFHYLGGAIMLLFGGFSAYIENRFRRAQNDFSILVYLSISLYLILAIEYPENSTGVLWLLIIGLSLISILRFFIKSSLYR